ASRTCDSIVFDSEREMKAYRALKVLADMGIITDLKLQPVFVLQEGFTKNGIRYRPIKYVADFSYVQDGRMHVCDAKGCKVPVYSIKKKLFEAKFAELRIEEI